MSKVRILLIGASTLFAASFVSSASTYADVVIITDDVNSYVQSTTIESLSELVALKEVKKEVALLESFDLHVFGVYLAPVNEESIKQLVQEVETRCRSPEYSKLKNLQMIPNSLVT